MLSLLLKLQQINSKIYSVIFYRPMIELQCWTNLLCTSLETMSSISLVMVDAALTILGTLESHSKASCVTISPMLTKDKIIRAGQQVDISALLMYSSIVGMYPSLSHLASTT